MPTWKSKPCRWPAIVPSVLGLLGTCGGALAQVAPDKPAVTALPAQAAQEEEQELYLEVTLNGVTNGTLGRFVRRGGAFLASAETLREMGLKWPGGEGASGLVALSALPGLQVSYDVPAQRLVLMAPVDLLARPVVRLVAETGIRALVDPSTQVPGLILNYDLYAQQTGNQRSVSAFSEVRFFGVGDGVWSNTMLSRADSNISGLDRHGNIRLDTYWQRNFPDQALTLTAGDVITGALPWSRATRIGGIRLSSNFALQPYRITTPLASFQGSAVLPSTVDLFVNGLKQSSQTVQPGQFQLSGVPSLGGTGQAQMVITDITGQRRVVSFDLYGAPQLLAEGLSDWSLDMGTVRRNYGLSSFSYGGQLFSASGRYGLSPRTTLEAHAEAGSGVVQAGLGGVWLLGEQGGLLSASMAGSRQSADNAAAAGTEQSGTQRSMGYQWNSRRFTVSLNTQRRDAGFRDVATLPGEVMSRGSDSAYFGINGGLGQFGVSTMRQQYFGALPVRFAGLSWSYQLPGNAMLALNVNRSLGDAGGTSVYLSWSMPLDRNLTVSGSARSAGGARSLTADAARSPPGDVGGWGWRVQAGVGDNAGAQGQISNLGRYGQWTAGVSQFAGQQGAAATRSVYGSANGGLMLMQGNVYAARRVDDAFALVSTSGVPGVPVRLENRVVGETDAQGMLFVTQLNAYQVNRLSIDTLKLPADMRIARSTLEAVPPGRSGMLARFDMRRILAVQLALRDAKGAWLAAGSQVWLDAAAGAGKPPAAATVVGYDGLVYLEDPVPGAVLRVETPAGPCRAALPSVLQPSGLLDLGVLTCQ